MKIGDYVKVKDGIELDNGDLSKDWMGKIVEIDGDYITIELDAQTLSSISDEYLSFIIDGGLDEYNYIFERGDLEIAKRRDTDEYCREVSKIFINRISILEDGEMDDETYFESVEEWTGEFLNSKFSATLSEDERNNAAFAIDVFTRYSLNYIGEKHTSWNKATIDEVCLDIIPRKVSSEIEFFENLGNILKHFFTFMADKELIPSEFSDYVYSIRHEIPKKAKNPANWGMAKSIMMGGIEDGVDLDDEDALSNYMNSQMFVPRSMPFYDKQEPERKSELAKIGRNDKVTVKYSDGKVIAEVKFKKVMKDLESGKCILVK